MSVNVCEKPNCCKRACNSESGKIDNNSCSFETCSFECWTDSNEEKIEEFSLDL